MTGINGVTGTTPAATATLPTTAGTTSSGTGRTQLDQEAFLKLLVAQLKYQDPTSPADATKFLTETAQFTVVEKLGSLSDLSQKVLDATRSQSAAALLGRTVTYTDASGKAATGVVTGSTIGGSPTLTVSGVDVALDAVTGVRAAG